MDFLAGIKGKDFVLVCGDTRAVQSIVQMKNTEDKLVPIDDHKLFGLSGEAGDRVNFSQYLIANIKLYALRNDMSMSTKAIASYTRNELATALRKNPYQTNLLLAGYDKGVGPSLYWCDYLATLHQMNVCATGYGAYFVLSLFDRHWTPDITREQAIDLMRKGVEEVKERLVVAPPKFLAKIVDGTGIQVVGDM
ncbi:proteasome subunit protein [Helicosporidium sp. ATCC 50920]|nr:proteasome subunit protein [Helicosporidium sp. ATCC 50920]|eukprot:KDD76170.1 proteasome subunit protein [Helicosporidium sp. ATCC 50920]